MDLNKFPRRVDRRTAAKIITDEYFPVSHRTSEAWPLPVQRVNGKATLATADVCAHAEAKLQAAPVLMGGRKSPARIKLVVTDCTE